MKSRVKLITGFTLLFIFSCNQINAQKSTFPKLLNGEWTKVDQSGPGITDTITLTRKLVESSENPPRWEFTLPDKLILTEYSTDSSSVSREIIALTHSFNCDYDKRSKLLRLSGSKYEAYFKIIAQDKQTINLICVK